MKLNDEQKYLLADKLLDLANFVAGALIIGQALTPSLNWTVLIAGFISVIVFYIFSLNLRR
ncbi:MAG: hypothetical protein A2Z59_11030 [Nitrospinae bacterium RIFCSPLOWO2_02_39_17]|nr:MAG: hypothetical protein A2Z59_11030 [Nitrospinae bacterium RIFCSPLOWO2_02_39_17]